ncbi:MAG: DUF1552 domain-containing protein [Nannocystales bacterium]
MIKRRRFLRGMGSIAVGLPLLRKFIDPSDARAGGKLAAPKRIIMCAYEMGTIRDLFTPSAVGSSFDFGTVTQSMEPFKARSMVVTNLNNAVVELTGGSAGHPGKRESVFSGTLMTGAFSGDGSSRIENIISSYSPGTQDHAPNGPTVETVIGDRLRHGGHLRSAINLGVATRSQSTSGSSDFFYESPENPITLQYHPGNAFDMLFTDVSEGESGPDPALLALRRRQKSVLDGVRDAFVDLRQGLDARDRAVLDDHADKIRQVELDLPTVQACTIPERPMVGGEDSIGDELSMSELAPIQSRLMAYAMSCDMAPVGRFEYGNEQNPYFGIPLVDSAVASSGWHSPIVHKADGWASHDPVRIAGFSFYVEQFANLLGELDSIVEDADGRTVLDNSLVVLGSDLGDGDGHRARDLSFLIAGGTERGRWQYHIDGDGYDTNQLLVTLMHLADARDESGGLPDEFGLQGFSSGPIDALLNA